MIWNKKNYDHRINKLQYVNKIAYVKKRHKSAQIFTIRFKNKNNQRFFINPFVPHATFLYPLKASEKLTIFWFFPGVEKRCVWKEWVN